MEIIVIILIALILIFVIWVQQSDKYWKKEREKYKPSVIVLPPKKLDGDSYYLKGCNYPVYNIPFFIMTANKSEALILSDYDHATQMLEIVREQYKRANLEEV